jgi:hypothetical protein
MLDGTTVSQGYATFNSHEAAGNPPQLVVAQNSAAPQQAIVASAGAVSVPEGSSASFTVELAAAPAADVVVDVVRSPQADADLTASPAQLTFTPANWDVPQTVTVSAAQDADAADGAAAFLLQSAGLGTTTVTATEADDDVTTPTIVMLADAADAHVRDGSYATQNFGQATRMDVKNSALSGFRRQAFVRFDLTGVGSAADITSAKVRLFGNILSAEAASLPVGIYSVANTTWGENAITFNTAPATSAGPLATDTVTGTTGAWYDYDITNYLKQQKTAGATAVAFALKSTITSEGFVGFSSDEATANQPQLVVTQNGTSGAMTSVADAIVSPNLAAAPGGQHYVYKTVRGNGTIVARVNGLGNTSAASEAGLVIRPDTGLTSAFVDLHVTGDGHAELDFRPTAGGSIHSGTPVAAGAGSWLMLVRDGNSFAGYLSPTGVDGTWQLVGTAGVQMATFTQFGLAVDAVAGATVNTATFGNVSVRATAPLGGNLDFQSDRVQDLPFVDLVKTTRGFFNVAGRLAPNVQPPQPAFATTDANGWPTEDFTFAAVDNTEWNVDVKPGVYKTAFTGPAGVVVTADGGVTVSQTGFDAGTGGYTYDVTVPAGVKKLQLTFKNTAGQVRNLRVLQPGYSLTDTPTFTADYLNLLKLVSPNTLRLMDFVQTNNNPVVNWSDRTQPTDATQTKVAVPGDLQASKGIAWEYAIDLANAVHKDVWVNIPIGATDDYVRNLAAMLRDRLAPDLNIYVEYSNEVWNAGFSQYQTNLNLAKAEVAANPSSNLAWTGPGPTTSATWANRLYARRAKQISDLFRSTWTGAGLDDPINTRVRMILGGQASAPSRAADELAYLNQFYGAPKGYLYGVAVAPYINLGSQQKVEGLTKAQVLAALTASLVSYETGGAGQTLVSAFKTANSYGLRLEAYEGGIDTFEAASKDAKAAAVLDPQIQSIMTRYLNNWYAKGGDQINWFTVGARSYNTPYGTWAITDSYARLNAPKILGFQQVRDATPVNVSTGLVVYA